MNERKNSTSLISVKNSSEESHKDVAVSTESGLILYDGEPPPRSTVTHSASNDTYELKDREPVFVLVDSSLFSNPSSRELLVENNVREPIPRKYFHKNFQPIDMPSTSREFRHNIELSSRRSDSYDEMQVIDINLQSENEISIDGEELQLEEESVVLSYLQNRDAHLDLEGKLLSTKKKSSLLDNVPKMETIVEEISENSLDVYIPSYPGSPRSINIYSSSSGSSREDSDLGKAVNYLNSDNDLLEAAELGDDESLEKILQLKGINVHQTDHLGRTALHLSVSSGNVRSMELLLKAGLDPDIKDKLGMTALSLCLMRNPTPAVANLLFDYGATILPRTGPMDTGLFIQFVAMCIPTHHDEQLLELLVKKGALVNDPQAPGGRQPLHIAALGNNCRLISKLIQLGAKTNIRNVRGETPKDFALLFDCTEAYELLSQYDDEGDSTFLSSTTMSGNETERTVQSGSDDSRLFKSRHLSRSHRH